MKKGILCLPAFALIAGFILAACNMANDSKNLENIMKPYILGNQVVFTFDRKVLLKSVAGIKVKRKPAGESSFVNVIDLDKKKVIYTLDRKGFKITLPATPKIGDQYEIDLEAGAVENADKKGQTNKKIVMKNKETITIGAAPSLYIIERIKSAEKYFSSLLVKNDVMTINFDLPGLTILDKNKIHMFWSTNRDRNKVHLFDDTEIPDTNIVLDDRGKSLKITLPSTTAQEKRNFLYRFALQAGAVARKNSVVNNTIIAPFWINGEGRALVFRIIQPTGSRKPYY